MPPALVSAAELGVELADLIQVQVPEVWLRTNERLSELAYKMDASRTRRAIAACLEQEKIALEGMQGLGFAGRIWPHGEGELLTVDFTAAEPDAGVQDDFRYTLSRVGAALEYSVQKRSKAVDELWGGGCVPRALQDDVIPAIGACESVARSAGRFGRPVVAEDVDFDWVPSWEYASVKTPDDKGNLRALIASAGRAEPAYLILATWSLTVEERPSVAGGDRVRMVLDASDASLIAAWDEQWRELF